MAGIMGLGCQTSSPKIMQVHTASKIPTADNGRAQDGSSKRGHVGFIFESNIEQVKQIGQIRTNRYTQGEFWGSFRISQKKSDRMRPHLAVPKDLPWHCSAAVHISKPILQLGQRLHGLKDQGSDAAPPAEPRRLKRWIPRISSEIPTIFGSPSV